MKCSNCNIEFDDDLKYCCHCGRELKQEITVAKCFDVFAKLGFSLGIVSLCLFLCFGIGILFADHAIVFSALGKKSIENRKRANAGLIISIISFVINLIIFIMFVVVFAIQLLAYLILIMAYGQ